MSGLSSLAFSLKRQARLFTVSFLLYPFLSGGLRGKRETAAAALLRKVRNIVVNKVSFVFTSQEKNYCNIMIFAISLEEACLLNTSSIIIKSLHIFQWKHI